MHLEDVDAEELGRVRGLCFGVCGDRGGGYRGLVGAAAGRGNAAVPFGRHSGSRVGLRWVDALLKVEMEVKLKLKLKIERSASGGLGLNDCF